MGTVGINFGSATSGAGFDVTTTVASIVGNLKSIETPWNDQLTALQADDTALTSIGTDLATLSSSLQSLTDFEGVMAEKEGSSSNPDVLTLSAAGATATAGSHTITVGQLAQTASDYSDPVAAADIISGALTIQVGAGTATTVPVVSGTSDTLSTYAAAINAADIGVRASVISDTTGVRLSLVSNTSGSAGALTVTQGGAGAASSSATAAATDVAPTDTTAASNIFTLPSSSSKLSGTFGFQVEGLNCTSGTVNLGSTPLSLTDAADALNSDSEFSAVGLVASVSGSNLVITGSTDSTGAATIDTTASDLTTTTPGTAYGGLADTTHPASALKINAGLKAQDATLTVDGISVDSSSNTVSTAIPGVTFQLLSTSDTPVTVEITNDNSDVESAVQSFVSAYNTVLGDLKTQEGNSSSGTTEPLYGNPIVSQLQSALALALTSGTASGGINSLVRLGISVTNNGTLSLNTSTLDSALNSSYSDVVGFFQNNGSFGQTLTTTLSSLGSSRPSGAISLALSSNSSQETALNNNITAQNTLISTEQTNLTNELNLANATLQAIPQQLNEINELYSAITGYNTGTG